MTNERPAWVWVISIFTLLSVGISLLTVLAATLVPMSEIDTGMAPLTLFDYGSVLVFSLTGAIAAIYLLRLKKAAFYWFTVPFMASTLLIFWEAITIGVKDGFTLAEEIGYATFGIVVGLAICVYCWSLVQKGVLD